MNIRAHFHIPFAQLQVETKVLFYIYAMGTVAGPFTEPPSPRAIYGALELIWDENKLVPSDISDSDRMTVLLKSYIPLFLKAIPAETPRIHRPRR